MCDKIFNGIQHLNILAIAAETWSRVEVATLCFACVDD